MFVFLLVVHCVLSSGIIKEAMNESMHSLAWLFLTPSLIFQHRHQLNSHKEYRDVTSTLPFITEPDMHTSPGECIYRRPKLVMLPSDNPNTNELV